MPKLTKKERRIRWFALTVAALFAGTAVIAMLQ